MPTSSNFDIHHLPLFYGLYHGMIPHNGFQHHPSLRNHRIIRVSINDLMDEHGRNMGEFTHFDDPESSNSSNLPIYTRHNDFAAMLPNIESYLQPQYHNQLGYENYIGADQRAEPCSIWMDPHSDSNGDQGNGFGWNNVVTYFPNNGGYPPSYLHRPPYLHHYNHHQNYNYQPPPLIARGQNMNFYPHVVENYQSFMGTESPALGAFQPHYGEVEANPRGYNFSHLSSFLPEEEEDQSFDFLDDYVDIHSDMRMNIEDMSFEQLCALEERMGNVDTGLSEETIINCMKIRIYSPATPAINLEELRDELCVICQNEYENRDEIGTLECKHEYHAKCLMKWLLLKNVCPICKSAALPPKQ